MEENFAIVDAWDAATVDHHPALFIHETQALLPVLGNNVAAVKDSSDPQSGTYIQSNSQ